jgi:hypothetical protein
MTPVLLPHSLSSSHHVGRSPARRKSQVEMSYGEGVRLVLQEVTHRTQSVVRIEAGM